jgi:hypothetical protein
MQVEVVAWLLANWIALIGGLLGLGIRFSRVALPNGGAEPKSIFGHLWRLTRVWIEATASAFVWAILGLLLIEFKHVAISTTGNPLFLAAAVFVGAAGSDLWARWASNPSHAPKDTAEAVGGLVDVWRRFKGDVVS